MIKKIGITGQRGFVGSHLYNTLGLLPEEFERVEFHNSYFDSSDELQKFVSTCDIIVHLAAMNRSEDPQLIYNTNIKLVKNLIQALEHTKAVPHVLFSSSSQEDNDNPYGKSKQQGRALFEDWAKKNNALFTGMVIPNVFGAFGKPYYNSFIATFCHQLTHGETPEVHNDSEVKLVYVQELVEEIIKKINTANTIERYAVPHTATKKVSDVLATLKAFKTCYFDRGEIPELKDAFDINLFNTYRSFIDYNNFFPAYFKQHVDPRGSFVEVIRLGVGGQVSFSTTVPGITRGNHYHTRKIERFAVIKGKALIQLRRIGTNEVLDFYLDGDKPSYVDMPIWYTHNIKNIGNEVLYTNFWINEFYNPDDADTYFENV